MKSKINFKRIVGDDFLYKVILTVVFVLLIAIADTSKADHVKKSSNGICHSPDSRYYNNIDDYESYHSLAECIDPSKRTSNTNDEKTPDYNRIIFGGGWADLDRDCQNTRHEELINQSTGQVYFASFAECRVVRGRWISPYTNNIITDATILDVDHIVPLKYLHDAGAYKRSYEERKLMANDPINLWVVELSLNRSKGAKGPSEWLPPENQCQYMLRFSRVLKKYDLEPNEDYSDLQAKYCN